MGYIRVKGTVSAMNERTTISGTANSIQQDSTLHFRIDGRPVSYKAPISISNGDSVTAVCKNKAEPVVVALRNHTTNVDCGPNWQVFFGIGVVAAVASLPLMFYSFWFILLLAYGLSAIWNAKSMKQVMKTLE